MKIYESDSDLKKKWSKPIVKKYNPCRKYNDTNTIKK